TDSPLLISHALDYKGTPMRLRGIVYGGQNHFTCRVVDSAGVIYRHDGMYNGDVCERESLLGHVSPVDLGTWRGRDGDFKTAVVVLYE
ncbi:hypothetical protein K525DRAFT_148741, partial [Schizophyllum commune Loenen D]